MSIDLNQLQHRIEQLIKEGDTLLSCGCKSDNQRAIEWFEKVNILNERYLNEHPSHNAIHTVYFHSKLRTDSIEEMISKLRAVLHDEDFFSTTKEPDAKGDQDTFPKPINPNTNESPLVFISYSWDSEEHRLWVKGLADMLLSEGVAVLIDQYDLNPGDRLTTFMEKSITDCDRALIICTPQYKSKADERLAGVGYESNIITADILQKHNDLKYIPIIRSGNFDSAMPTYMSGKLAVDLRESNSRYNDSVQDLLATIRGETKKPALKTNNSHNTQRKTSEAANDNKPLHIIGIITDEVTLPRNDGTRGSALYAIPFRLSGYPNTQWCEYFIHCWDYPTSFTTMHRPGIATVRGNKIILNGTTIEEVQQYHRKTLIDAVKRANEMLEHDYQRAIREQERMRKLEEEHNKKIADIASSIDFNE